MSEIIQFMAMPFDLTDKGLVAGQPFKCASPGDAIDRAKAYWKTLGHAGAIAFVSIDYPVTRTTVLERFGSVISPPLDDAPED